MALALLLGLFANFTVIGSVAPSGIVPFSFWIARSASILWSNRMNPTPFDRPGTQPSPLFTPGTERERVSRVVGASASVEELFSKVTARISFQARIYFRARISFQARISCWARISFRARISFCVFCSFFSICCRCNYGKHFFATFWIIWGKTGSKKYKPIQPRNEKTKPMTTQQNPTTRQPTTAIDQTWQYLNNIRWRWSELKLVGNCQFNVIFKPYHKEGSSPIIDLFP